MSESKSLPKKASKDDKKNSNKSNTKKVFEEDIPSNYIRIYIVDANDINSLKVIFLAQHLNISFALLKVSEDSPLLSTAINYPFLVHNERKIYGAHAIVRYLASSLTIYDEDFLNIDEFQLSPAISSGDSDKLLKVLSSLEGSSFLRESTVGKKFLVPSLEKVAKLPEKLASIVSSHSNELTASKTFLSSQLPALYPIPSSAAASATPVVVSGEWVQAPPQGTLHSSIDWESSGLFSALKIIFTSAISAAFPNSIALNLHDASIARCANPTFGDFQCNSPMALAKALKGLSGYTGPVAPKAVADRIIAAIPTNPLVDSSTAAPNGFINIKLSPKALVNSISSIVNRGVLPPTLEPCKILIDFSSPNIAKEMHVGHLRSTIIGDCLSNILEFCRFDVMRVNHVGDWGTQFGMLITYLLDTFPDILSNPPDISDLTVIYKASKKRFDEDENFKERSRLNVVNLQSGEATCRKIWLLLCEISRKEFQNVYDLLGVRLEEFGESFYNPFIPRTNQELVDIGLAKKDEGMLVVKLPHFTIPLIIQKSDGGYGYDSTDMAALKYRLFDLKRDWIIVITDAGQAPHFHMCYDAGRAAGWLQRAQEEPVGRKEPRLNHIGFGVVCGDDGKRFKTRSSETVRLVDLLNAAKDRMKESLQQRLEEGKSSLTGESLDAAAAQIGYGAVKYFDLKQHPATNYIFSYDRMLDTRGDTAVYLMFAYARFASILRKAKDERNVDLSSFAIQTSEFLTLNHPAERALAFELMQFGDVIQYVIGELLPNRLCDYLKEVAVVGTDFVTRCHVLNAEEGEIVVRGRLILCEATRRVMEKCFTLLGISPLDRI